MPSPNNYRKRTYATPTTVAQVLSEMTAPQGATLGYTDGVLTSVTKGGITKTLSYTDGRLTKVTSPTAIVNLSYDSAGLLSATTVTNA